MEQEKSSGSIPTSFFIDVIGIVVIFIVLKELQQIFIPLVLAYFLFFVFSPINRFLEKKHIPLSVSVVLDLLIMIFVIGSFSSVIVDSLGRLATELPNYTSRLDNIVSNTAASWGIKDPYYLKFHISDLLTKIDYSPFAGDLFASTFSFLGYVFFILFFFIFVVTGHDQFYAAIKKRYNKPDFKGDSEKSGFIQSTFNEITDQIQNYVFTKFIMSLVMSLVIGLILWAFGVDFAIVWALITLMLHFIPNIGSIIAVLLPCLMSLVQFESFGYTAILALTLIVVQNVIGSILEPKVFGNRLGINPLVILLSLLLWGYIWGIVGAILSVPLTAVIKIIISRSQSKNLQLLNDLMSN